MTNDPVSFAYRDPKTGRCMVKRALVYGEVRMFEKPELRDHQIVAGICVWCCHEFPARRESK